MKNYWLAICAAAFSLALVSTVAIATQPQFNPNQFKRDSIGNLLVTCRTTPAPSDKRLNGFYIDSSGNLLISNCTAGTPRPTPTAVPTSTATPTNPGFHLHTVAYGWGYNGISTNVPIATQSQFLDYAYQGAYNTQYQAAGIKTIAYSNFWAGYPSDNPVKFYQELAPVSVCQANASTYHYTAANCTGTYVSQEAKTCAGTPIVDNHYGGGYVNAPYISTANFAALAKDRTGIVSENYVFSDDTAVNFNGSPCNTGSSFSASQWVTDTENAMAAVTNAFVGAPMFANLLNAEAGSGNTPVTLAPIVVNTATIVGGMAENAFISSGGSFDSLTDWTNDENACIIIIQGGKICWIYSSLGAITNGISAITRTYALASFLLTYNQPYSIFEESITGLTDTFPVMPETALVPVNPIETPNTISDLATNGGYFREWTDCFWNGNDIGKCAVAVNPNSSGNMTLPAGYTHAMVIPAGNATSDWNAGGLNQISLTGTAVTTVGPLSAEIVFP